MVLSRLRALLFPLVTPSLLPLLRECFFLVSTS